MKARWFETTLSHLIATPAWLLFLMVLLIIIVSYSNTIYSPFVLDDTHSFIEDPKVFVNDLSITSLQQLSTTQFGISRFLPIVSFAVDHHLSNGKSIVPYHITNIIIHLLATTGLFFFLAGLMQTCIGKRSLSLINHNHFILFVCAIWALNPVQTNAVTYVVQRMTSMAALFYLVALACYIHGRLCGDFKKKIFFYSGFMLAATCAFLSKQNSATLPVAVLLVEFMFISPGLGSTILKRLKWYHYTALILLLIISLPLGEHCWNVNLNSFSNRHFTMIERLLTESRVIIFYLSLLALPLPSRMNLEHDFPVSHSFFDPPSTLAAIILLTLLVGFAINYRRRFPLVAFGIFWFFLNLLIESTIFNLELVFEHRLYLPSVGFFIALMALVDLLLARFQETRSSVVLPQILFLIMIIVVSLLSVMTTLRNNDWRDGVAIYEDCVRKSPEKARVYTNLGVALGQEKRYDEALQVSEKAITLGRPKYEEYLKAANNIMVILIEQGRPDEAIKWAEEYLKEAPDGTSSAGFIQYMHNLGLAYYKTGQYPEAMKRYASGLVLEEPDKTSIFVRLMVEALTAGYDKPESRERLKLAGLGDKQRAIQLRMAMLLLDLRVYDHAVLFINKLLESDPEDQQALGYKARYQTEREKNKRQAENIVLQNHQPYKTNPNYRYLMATSDFIIKYYSPLSLAVGWLLDKAQAQAKVADPFVALYRIKWHIKEKRLDVANQELRKAPEEHPDFVPLLELAGRHYDSTGNKEDAQKIYAHVLELYPDHPDWYYFQKLIKS